MLLIFNLIVCLFFGISIAGYFVPKNNLGEKIALSLPLGFGVISLTLFLIYSIHLPIWIFKTISTVFIVAIIILFFNDYSLIVKKCFNNVIRGDAFTKISLTGKLVWQRGVLSFLFLISLFFSIYFPTITPDGFIYDYFGKVLADSNDMDIYLDELPVAYTTPMVPILHSYFYQIKFNYPKIIYPIFYLATVLFTYFKLKEKTKDKHYAITFALILATTPVFWWRSFLTLNNLICASYFYFAVVYWYEALENKSENIKNKLLLSGLCFSFALWTRMDFFLYFFPALVLLTMQQGEKKNLIYFCCFPLLLASFWIIHYKIKLEISLLEMDSVSLLLIFIWAYLTFHYFNKNIRRGIGIIVFISVLLLLLLFQLNFIESLYYIFTELLLSLKIRLIVYVIGQWYWIFTVFLFLFIPIFWKKLNKPEKQLTYFLLLFFVAVQISMYGLGSPRMKDFDLIFIIKSWLFEPGNHINGSSQRIFIAIYPLLIFLVGNFIYRQKIQGIYKWFSFKNPFNFLFYLIIFGNISLLIIYFAFPGIQFIYKHPDLDFKQVLISNNLKGIKNIYRSGNKLAFKIKENIPDNATVFFPDEEISGAFSIKNIIFPIKGIFINKPYSEILNLPAYKDIYFVGTDKVIPPDCCSEKTAITLKENNWQIYKLIVRPL